MSDRLALAHAIEDAGIERGKAERVASVIVDVIRDSVATKADLQHTEAALKADSAIIRADLRLLKWQVGLLFAIAGPTLLLLIRVAVKAGAIG